MFLSNQDVQAAVQAATHAEPKLLFTSAIASFNNSETGKLSKAGGLGGQNGQNLEVLRDADLSLSCLHLCYSAQLSGLNIFIGNLHISIGYNSYSVILKNFEL